MCVMFTGYRSTGKIYNKILKVVISASYVMTFVGHRHFFLHGPLPPLKKLKILFL